MDLKEIKKIILQIAKEREIPQEKIIEAFESALASAYKKEFGKKGQRIEAKVDWNTGELKFFRVLYVVDEGDVSFSGSEAKEEKIRFHPEKHILLSEAKKIDPSIEPGQELTVPIEPPHKEFGRIASQTAKQVLVQKIREIEKDTIFENMKKKEGEIVSGVIQKVENQNVFIDLGKILGVLPKSEQIPNEFYRLGQRIKTILLRVERKPKETEVILSRNYPKFLSKLFELEVPEISSGQIEIKSIAREPGSRSKIALVSNTEGLDPIGACIGQRGIRIQTIISELGGEKIDVIEYSPDPQKYIANALSPAKVLEVKILPKNRALAIVPDDQLSLAIGKDGQNARLAAKLTNWKIDVISKSEYEKNPEAGDEPLELQ